MNFQRFFIFIPSLRSSLSLCVFLSASSKPCVSSVDLQKLVIYKKFRVFFCFCLFIFDGNEKLVQRMKCIGVSEEGEKKIASNACNSWIIRFIDQKNAHQIKTVTARIFFPKEFLSLYVLYFFCSRRRFRPLRMFQFLVCNLFKLLEHWP